MRRRKYPAVADLTLEVLQEAVAKVQGKTELELYLYGHPRSGRPNDLESRVLELGLSIEHWTGRHVPHSNRGTPKKCLGSLSKQAARKRVLEGNLLEEKCAKCGSPPLWQGEPLTLHLDHIDGNGDNHELSNLRFLCPNCHQQTGTWGNKRSRKLPEDEVLRKLSKTMSYRELAAKFGVHPSSISHVLRKYYG